MAHFAELDGDNKVIRVIVVANEVTTPDGVNENEQLGIDFLNKLYPESGKWVQTSYNWNFRKRLAGKNFTYNEEADVFICPRGYDSWVLNPETHDWEAPIPRPADDPNWTKYLWNEISGTWKHPSEAKAEGSYRGSNPDATGDWIWNEELYKWVKVEFGS